MFIIKIERNYPALNFISGLYKFLAILTAIVGVLIAFNGHWPEAFMGLIFGTIGCVTLLAVSELLKLFINIEENTRRSANLLDKDNEVKPEIPSANPYQDTKDSPIQTMPPLT